MNNFSGRDGNSSGLAMQRWPTMFVALALLLVLGGSSSAQDASSTEPEVASVRPGINEEFLDPDLDVEEWIERFEIESRETYAARHEVIRAMRIAPGQRIADIGAGTGFYALAFAEASGDGGWVFALDIAPRFVEHLGMLIEDRRRTNITPVLSGEADIRLPPESVDVAFSSDVYHHIEYPERILRSILRALRPGGRMFVVDFERIPGESSEWILEHVRAGKETVRLEIEAAGFEFVGEQEIEGFRENYFLEFRKPK